MDSIKLAAQSLWQFIKLVSAGKLHRRKDRLGRAYLLGEYGEYRIFRETVGNDGSEDKPVVLVVGFRLKLLGINQFWHKLFQKVCILTTPFWSGFRGFRVKLWMVQPRAGNYMGIYEWAGKEHAQEY